MAVSTSIPGCPKASRYGLIAPGLYVVGLGGYAISDCSSVTNMPEGSPVDRFIFPTARVWSSSAAHWVSDKAKSFLPGLPPPVGSDGFNVDLTQRDQRS